MAKDPKQIASFEESFGKLDIRVGRVIAWGLYLVYCAVCSIEKDKKKAYLTVGASVCIITMDLKFLTPALMN